VKRLEKLFNELKKYIDWIVCLIFSIFIALISFYFLSPENNIFISSLSTDGILYLFSAISQSLAAIFALVFTVTLMAATMANKYTAIDKFFNIKTKILMILFIIAIILPLLLLKIVINNEQINNIFISISIGLATFCIAGIIPHLKGSNNILKFDIGVDNLISELHESTMLENYSKATTVVYDLLDIGENAIKEKKDDSIAKINNGILNHIKIAILRTGGILPTFSAYTPIYALNTLGKSAANKHMDEVAVSLIHSLRESGILLITKDVYDSSVQEIIFTFHQMGITACKNHLKNTAIFSMRSLLALAKATSSKRNMEYETKTAYYYFGICGAYLEKYFDENVDFVYTEMKSYYVDIDEILPTETINKINNQFPEVKGFLEKFINGFN
jgi:hypothetical protein